MGILESVGGGSVSQGDSYREVIISVLAEI